MVRKKVNLLAEGIAYKTITTLKTAEEVANALMQHGKLRNIIRNKNIIRNYIAAAIYVLATNSPVEVMDDQQKRNDDYPPVKCRSKVGDLCHLFILLSYRPSQVFRLFKEECIQEYLDSTFEMFINGKTEELNQLFIQLTDIMDGFLKDVTFTNYSKREYMLRTSVVSASQIIEPININAFEWSKLSLDKVISKCQNNINQLFIEKDENNELDIALLGERFKYLRLNMNLTQKMLGEKIGVSTIAVARIETGGPCSATTLFQYLKYFSGFINVDFLFDSKMWNLAMQDTELLVKKIHMNSVVNRKLELLKDNILKKIQVATDEINANLNEINKQVEIGMDSALSITGD